MTELFWLITKCLVFNSLHRSIVVSGDFNHIQEYIDIPPIPIVVLEDKPTLLRGFRLLDQFFEHHHLDTEVYLNITLDISYGNLFLQNAYKESTNPNGMKQLTFSSSVSALNIVLRHLTYVPPKEWHSFIDVIDVSSLDESRIDNATCDKAACDYLQVSIFTENEDLPISSYMNLPIYVSPVDDDPIICWNETKLIIMTEDKPSGLEDLNISISDEDDDYLTLEILVDDDKMGVVLELNKIRSLNISIDKPSKLSISGETKRINEALKNVVLYPAPNFFGFSVFQLTVSDSTNQVSKSSVIKVLPVIDLPTLHISKKIIDTQDGNKIHLGNIEIQYEDCCLDDEDNIIFFADASFGKVSIHRNSSIPLQFLHKYDNSSRYIMLQGNLKSLSLAISEIYYQPENDYFGSDVIHLKLIDRYEEIISGRINISMQRSKSIFDFIIKNEIIFLEEDTKWMNTQEIVQLDLFQDPMKDNLDSDLEEVHTLLVSAQYGHVKFGDFDSHSEVSFFGSIHEAREMIRRLTYIPLLDWTGVDNVTFHYALESVSINFVVTPVNDAPVISCKEPCKINVFEEKNVNFPSISIFDVDADDGDARATGLFDLLILANNGDIFSSSKYYLYYDCNELNLPMNDLEVSSRLCFQAKINEVNAFLSSLVYSPFTDAKSDKIQIHISDNGNWDGGSMRSKMSSAAIFVDINYRQVEQQIQIYVSPEYYHINEDESFTFKPELSISVNSITNLTAKVILNTTFGFFYLSSGQTFGLKEASIEKDGVFLEGQLAHLISFFENYGLTYFSRENFNGYDPINFKMIFTRPTGESFIAESAIYVHVNPVNDYPVLHSPGLLNGTQNTSIDLSLIMIDDADKSNVHGEVITFFVSTKIGHFDYNRIYPGVMASSTDSSRRIILKGNVLKINKYMKNENIHFIPPPYWFGETNITLFVNDSLGFNSSMKLKVLIDPKTQDEHFNLTTDIITVLEDNSFSFIDYTTTFKPFLELERIVNCNIFTSVGEVSEVDMFGNDLATNRVLYKDILKLVYTPETNFNGKAQIILECRNMENSGLYYNSYATIHIPLYFSPVNDPPSIKVVKDTLTLREGTEVKLQEEMGGIHISDPDAHENNDTITVNITVTRGIIYFPSSRSTYHEDFYWSSFKDGLILKGAVSTINFAMKEVKYKVPHQWIGNGSFTIFCSDHGYQGIKQQDRKESHDKKIIRFITVEQNDAPIIQYDSIDRFVTIEDKPLALKGIFSINDFDMSDNLTLTLEVSGEGKVNVGGFSFESKFLKIKNITVQEVRKIKALGASPIFIVKGSTITSLSRALDSIIFKPSVNWHGYMPNALNVTLSDSLTSTSAFFPLRVTSVNDAPSIIVSSDSLYSVDTEIFISDYISIYVEDEDIAHYPSLKSAMTVNVTTKFGGTLHLSKFISGCYVIYPITRNPSTSIIFRGTIDSVNEAIQNLVFLRYSDHDFLDILKIEVNDEGNFGQGGHLSSIINITLYLAITNESPMIRFPLL